MSSLDGKVALVTGCGSSGGIGWATAIRLAHDGADVAIHGRPNAEDATRELGGMVAAFGRRALRVTADLSKEADIVKMVDVAFQHFGRIDVLVNNAAVTGPFKPLDKVNQQDWQDPLAVNLRGVFFCSREVARIMSGQGTGAIINVVSGSAPGSIADGVIYSSTKAAVESLTKALASELVGKGIRVNAVAPGLLESPIGTKLRKQAARKKRPAGSEDSTPLTYAEGMPEDVASVIAFLASEDAAHLTGQVLRLAPPG